MSKFLSAVLALTVLLTVFLTVPSSAGSILPVLTEPEPEVEKAENVEMPSLEQVSWYDSSSVTKSSDGRLVYHYSAVSEEAYLALGTALGEAGYTLRDSSQDENGELRFVAGNDTAEMEIVYQGPNGNMDIYYPMNAVLKARDEDALTVHLSLGEPFLTTDECRYALESVKPVEQIRRIFKSGYPVVFRYDRTRTSTEEEQYVVFGFSCTNTVSYDIEGSMKIGTLVYDKEAFSWRAGDGKGWSNADFTVNNELESGTVKQGSTRYYVQVWYYNPKEYPGPIPMSLTYMSSDNVTRYMYDVIIGE